MKIKINEIFNEEILNSLIKDDDYKLYGEISTKHNSIVENKLINSNISKRKQIVKESFMKRFLIEHDSRCKKVFDIFVLILIGYTCIIITYDASYQKDNNTSIEKNQTNISSNNITLSENNNNQNESANNSNQTEDSEINNTTMDWIIESFFYLSIILEFFQKYQNKDTLEIVDTYKGIAYNYIFKGMFVFDIISVLPYKKMFDDPDNSKNARLFKLIRLIRFPKLIQLLNIEKFDEFINFVFSKSKSKNEKFNMISTLRYIYKIVRLIFLAVIITYFVGSFWYLYCLRLKKKGEINFTDEIENKEPFDKMIISSYFALTTLSTIGYGDLTPENNNERLFSMVIMLLGVALFSYVMGSFTDLISSDNIDGYKEKKNVDMHNWLKLLKNKDYNIKEKTLNNINRHLSYTWENKRDDFLSKKDVYMRTLTKKTKKFIMLNIWNDVFISYSKFFFYYDMNIEEYEKFYYDISFSITPVRFSANEIIYYVDQIVDEFYLIEGFNIAIGYSILKNKKAVKYNDSILIDVIGDFYCIFNRKSNYYYKSKDDINGYSISKEKFLYALNKNEKFYNKMRNRSYNIYRERIEKVIENEIENDIRHFNLSNNHVRIENLHNDYERDILDEENINKLIKKKSRIDINNLLLNESKNVTLEDDYINLSRFMWLDNAELEKKISKINKKLDILIGDKQITKRNESISI